MIELNPFDRRGYARVQYKNIDPKVIAWSNRVKSYGGGTISNNTLLSINWLYKELKYTTFFNKIKSLTCFVPDNLIAAITPLISTYGNAIWTNTNFTTSDLDIRGLKGNGSNKYLNTGVIPSSHFTANMGGVTIYVTQGASENIRDFGVQDGSSRYMFQHISFGNTCYFDCFTSCRATAANGTNWVGYISGNKTSSSSNIVYKANSVTNHNELCKTLTLNTDAPPNLACFLFCASSNGTPQFYSTKRFSFCAIHDGLTNRESLVFYNIIQTFRKKIGGGYV